MKILLTALVITAILTFGVPMLCFFSGDEETGRSVAYNLGRIFGWLLKIIVLLAAIQFIVGLFR